MRWRDQEATPADRVTAVETFFDVVFVFTLTQLTRTLEDDLSWGSAGRILLAFGVLWYMYGGFAWLTNHVPPRRVSQKLILFAAMAGFFVAAVGIPGAFDGTGVLFGLGYLLVVVVHLTLFTQSDALAGVLRLAPYNIGGALLILGAGFTDGATTYALWIAGYLLMTVVPYLVPRLSWVGAARSFHVAAEHFIERHGLLVMIALGESVIAIGMGVDTTNISAGTVGVIVMALALPGAMWWTYFTDYHAAERALAVDDTKARSLLAIRAYYFAHIPILLGIVVAAAGIHAAVAHPSAHATWPEATALATCVALFLAGIADFRRCMAIDSPAPRVAGAVAMFTTISVGAHVGAGLQLAAVLGIVVLMLVLDGRRAA